MHGERPQKTTVVRCLCCKNYRLHKKRLGILAVDRLKNRICYAGESTNQDYATNVQCGTAQARVHKNLYEIIFTVWVFAFRLFAHAMALCLRNVTHFYLGAEICRPLRKIPFVVQIFFFLQVGTGTYSGVPCWTELTNIPRGLIVVAPPVLASTDSGGASPTMADIMDQRYECRRDIPGWTPSTTSHVPYLGPEPRDSSKGHGHIG